MDDQNLLAVPGPSAAALLQRAIARHLGVRVRTLRALGLTFTDRASAERWLAEAPAEDLIALRASEIGKPLPIRAAA